MFAYLSFTKRTDFHIWLLVFLFFIFWLFQVSFLLYVLTDSQFIYLVQPLLHLNLFRFLLSFLLYLQQMELTIIKTGSDYMVFHMPVKCITNRIMSFIHRPLFKHFIKTFFFPPLFDIQIKGTALVHMSRSYISIFGISFYIPDTHVFAKCLLPNSFCNVSVIP
jgi:hypothetical protein